MGIAGRLRDFHQWLLDKDFCIGISTVDFYCALIILFVKCKRM
jgi:hypothetical protein